MSAEGKKKRGVSGLANAKAQPYRLNGGGCYPLYLRAILGPRIAAMIGHPPKK
jgi:hypothetical protein